MALKTWIDGAFCFFVLAVLTVCAVAETLAPASEEEVLEARNKV